jgi:hypothetical protein
VFNAITLSSKTYAAVSPVGFLALFVDKRLPKYIPSHFFLDKLSSKVCNARQCSA